MRTWLVALAVVLVLTSACRPTAAPTQAASVADNVVVGNVAVLPDDGREPMLRQIGSARTRIDVFAYLISDRTMIDALAAAARRAVNVRVLIERKPFGGDNAAMVTRLRSIGIAVRESNPAFRFSHGKVIIVDERVAMVGTANYTRSSFERNREFLAIVDDPGVVQSLVKLFEADWQRKPTPPLHPALFVSPESSRQRLTRLVDQARESLAIYQAETLDEPFARAIQNAAQRGVDVRYITSPDDSPDRSADARLLNRMRDSGVRVGLLRSPYIHAKVMLVDLRLAAIGSVNATPTSFDLNREIGVVLNDPDVVETVRATFERDWSTTQ